MLLLAGCTAIRDVRVEVDADIETLVRVSFRTAEAAAGQVSWDSGATPVGPVTTDHRFTLLGLVAGETYQVSPGVVDGPVAEAETVTTGRPPGSVATFAPVLDGDGPGYILTNHITGEEAESSVVILDSAARTTWYAEAEWGFVPAARFSVDGEAVLYMVTSKREVEDAVVRRQPLAGGPYEEIATPYGHHDFVEVPGVGLAYIAAEGRTVDGEAVVGDRIVERLEDGSEREVWNAFDWIPVVENDGWNNATYTFGVDWSHANGLAWDAASDAYLLSLYWDGTVVKVDRATGDTTWFLGGPQSDFVLPEGFAFRRQHAPSVTDDGEVCVYDNVGGDGGSRGLCYALGEEAALAWSFDPEDARSSILMGDLDRDADGALMAFGESGQITRIDAGGAATWEIDAEDVGVVGKAEARTSLYPP